MEERHIDPPTTVRELGIHFQGFKELVDERFNNLTETVGRLADALEASNTNKADQKDLLELVVRVKALESKRPWVLVLCTILLTSIITFFLQLEITKLLGAK